MPEETESYLGELKFWLRQHPGVTNVGDGAWMNWLKSRPKVREEVFQGQELPPRGTGLLRGTARTGLARGRGRALSEEERRERHKRIFGE